MIDSRKFERARSYDYDASRILMTSNKVTLVNYGVQPCHTDPDLVGWTG
jgi:hypothetical protein